MGRPIVAPPDVPVERIATLRKAVMETLRDPEFLAEAEKIKVEINPVNGDEIQALVQESFAMPAEIVKKTGDLLRGPTGG
jgi:tripartite-type tricarboxylate transporter receptor subunit TctC